MVFVSSVVSVVFLILRNYDFFTSLPHLSTSVPQYGHVLPPQNAWRIFFGFRINGKGLLQCGQVILFGFTPHLFLFLHNM